MLPWRWAMSLSHSGLLFSANLSAIYTFARDAWWTFVKLSEWLSYMRPSPPPIALLYVHNPFQYLLIPTLIDFLFYSLTKLCACMHRFYHLHVYVCIKIILSSKISANEISLMKPSQFPKKIALPSSVLT